MTIPSITAVVDRTRTTVRRDYHRVTGANVLVYVPDEPATDGAGVLVASMHGGLNATLESPFLERLAEYGIPTAFCVPDQSSFIDQFVAMDACMALLRTFADTIVLMGQSRGAALMSGYQKIAENGPGVFQGPERLLPIPEVSLRPADGLMLLDANFGTTIMHVMSLNPARVDENRAASIDPDLDPTNPANGYRADGGSCFSPEFRKSFFDAQRRRYDDLLTEASRRVSAVEAGEGVYGDNEPFIVADGIGINNAPKLFASDLSLLARTAQEWPLIHADGSITTETVPSVRVDQNNPSLQGTLRAAYVTTVRDYLWTAVRLTEDYGYGEDGVSGIDFDSSMTCATGNVAMISVPLLLMGHTGGYEYIGAEWSYERAASEDKSIAFMAGATHGWTPIDEDRFGDTLDIEARFVAQWLLAPGRFAAKPGGAVEARPTVVLDEGGVARLRSGLVGSWRSSDGSTARFSVDGASELSFADALTRYTVDPTGAIAFTDRYGVTTSFTPSIDAEDAAADPTTHFLSGDALVLGGVHLVRV